jgi:hypothetical protein
VLPITLSIGGPRAPQHRSLGARWAPWQGAFRVHQGTQPERYNVCNLALFISTPSRTLRRWAFTPPKQCIDSKVVVGNAWASLGADTSQPLSRLNQSPVRFCVTLLQPGIFKPIYWVPTGHPVSLHWGPVGHPMHPHWWPFLTIGCPFTRKWAPRGNAA